MARTEGSNRLKIFGAIGLLGLLLVGFGIWWQFFRDTAASEVGSDENQAAIAASIAEASDNAAATSADADDTYDEDDGTVTVDEASQPDAAASAGSGTDGVWRVDTSIGTFSDACLTEVCGAGFVGFRIDEVLARFGAKTVVGRTPAVTGSLEISGTQIISTEIIADMTQAITDDSGRTAALKSAAGGLDTTNFPEASFVLAEPIELGSLPVEGASINVDAVGDLTVHGTTNRVTIPMTAELQAGLIVVFGSLDDMVLADYDIPKPVSIVVVSVEETATMEFQLFFSR